MKNRFPSTIALALTAAVAASAAPAGTVLPTGNLSLDVQSAVGNDGNVNVSLRDGIATLTGNVDNALVGDTAVAVAREHEGVREVVDLLIES